MRHIVPGAPPGNGIDVEPTCIARVFVQKKTEMQFTTFFCPFYLASVMIVNAAI